jgi:hypothetical protein
MRPTVVHTLGELVDMDSEKSEKAQPQRKICMNGPIRYPVNPMGGNADMPAKKGPPHHSGFVS